MVNNIRNIQQALNNYFLTEDLDGDNCYFCEKCKKKVNAFKSIKVVEHPQYLLFVLKRFEFNMSYRHKINSFFEFPIDQLVMSEGIEYTLKGIIVHQGLS